MADDKKTKYMSKKAELLYLKGINEGTICQFDDDFNDVLKQSYILGMPVYFFVKYLNNPGDYDKNYDKSLFVFLCFDDAILVKGKTNFNKRKVHNWVEKDGYVYDPELLMRFNKDLYYQLYKPTDVESIDIKTFRSESMDNEDLYTDARETTIDKLLEDGFIRFALSDSVPIMQRFAKDSEDPEYKMLLDAFLTQVEYDPDKIHRQFVRYTDKLIEKYNIHF